MNREDKITALRELSKGNYNRFKRIIGPEPITGMLIIGGGDNDLYQVIFIEKSKIYPEINVTAQELEHLKTNPKNFYNEQKR
ncbi:hypothetical protein A8C56_02970 [Niabella ginsenosidivorans]|uniref:Uncharacterized protein n=1 Tax=Niabella ginsenosidivorans TaxID=1176587 RepID=A0A1A9HXV9_9BACT|nr:hypothetical protein [Niabella ginsenosidivorans]ANH80083.1 hypothetical protein A8C56_02970 [Niabella ginsenosidivorans]